MDVSEESAAPEAVAVLTPLLRGLRRGGGKDCFEGEGVMFLEMRSLRKFCWRLEDAVLHGFDDGFAAGGGGGISRPGFDVDSSLAWRVRVEDSVRRHGLGISSFGSRNRSEGIVYVA
jgi:hypothetical protein